MMSNHGVALPAEDLATATEYLIKNFAEKAETCGRAVAGPDQGLD